MKAALYVSQSVSQSRVALSDWFVNTFFQIFTEISSDSFGATLPHSVGVPRLFFACFGEARASPLHK